MYDHIGGKLKKIAKVLYVMGLIASVAAGIGVVVMYNFFMGLAVIALGALVSWALSIAIYGYGELIERFQNIEIELVKQH